MTEFAGSLQHRIEIWKRSEERLATGASVEKFHFVRSCLAAVSPEGSGALNEAMSPSAMPRFRFTVRTQPEFSVDQQVRWRSRRLRIQQLAEDPRLPDRMVLCCEEQR